MKHLSLFSLAAGLLFGTVAFAGEHTGVPRVSTLSGAEETQAADTDGSGFVEIRLNYGQGTVCWELTVENIVTARAAHIHRAPFGVAGPVVIPLSAPASGSSSGCAENVDPDLIKAIIQNPEEYYVNVHNQPFPGGAIRGQLSNPGQSD